MIRSKRPGFGELYPTLAFLRSFLPREMSELEAYHARVAEFREREVAPRALAIEREAREKPDDPPRDLLAAACRLRLFSSLLPSSLGGMGLPLWGGPVIAEEIAAGCLGIANLLFVNMLGNAVLAATLDLKTLARVLPQIAAHERRGRPFFIATAVTEPGAGSDMEDTRAFRTAKISTAAEPVAGGYRVTGTKIFISNGSLASLVVLLVARPEGSTQIFLVTPDSPGFRVGRVEKKMGTVVCPAVELIFDHCFVPQRNVVESRVDSSDIQRLVLGLTRAGVGALGAGVARRGFELALDHCRETKVNGQKLIDQQWAQYELTTMARNAMVARASFIEAALANSLWGLAGIIGEARLPGGRFVPAPLARALVEKVAFQLPGVSATIAQRVKGPEARQRADRATVFGDHAKITGSDLAVENARRAILLMGADGVRADGQVEKLYRDAKLLQIYEGTNEVSGIDLFARLIRQPLEGPSASLDPR